MNVALGHVKHELAGVRTGRASVTSRRHSRGGCGRSAAQSARRPVGAGTHAHRGAAVRSVAAQGDPRRDSRLDLGLNPANDGKVIRIPLPALTEERRKELSRHVHKLTEEGRNTVRNVRRDANDRLKKLLKDHKISEDDERKGLEEIQRITDNHIKLIDETQKKKDAELLGK
jgi:ribosome recycling factor